MKNKGLKVRMEGLEPPRLAAPDPKSGTATNYATSACDNFFWLWAAAPDSKSVCQLTDNYTTSAKRRGKFIDN